MKSVYPQNKMTAMKICISTDTIFRQGGQKASQ